VRPARPQTSTPKQTDEVELDPFHGAIVDEVCASDAGRVAFGEVIFLRRAVEHEFCHPAGPCWTWPAWVIVRAVRPGVRIREPLSAGWVEVAS
jgi:hypothetical protein